MHGQGAGSRLTRLNSLPRELPRAADHRLRRQGPATVTHDDVSAMADGGQASGMGDDEQQKQSCSVGHRRAPAIGDQHLLEGGRSPAPKHFIRKKRQPWPIPKLARATSSSRGSSRSSMAHGSSASDWVRDVRAEDACQPKRMHGVEIFRTRDASHARAQPPWSLVRRIIVIS
ncbi:hypothetical protein VPH35_082452 [Triticum aestivum]